MYSQDVDSQDKQSYLKCQMIPLTFVGLSDLYNKSRRPRFLIQLEKCCICLRYLLWCLFQLMKMKEIASYRFRLFVYNISCWLFCLTFAITNSPTWFYNTSWKKCVYVFKIFNVTPLFAPVIFPALLMPPISDSDPPERNKRAAPPQYPQVRITFLTNS